MQSLIRSKSAGVAGGRGTAGAGPGRDLLYRVPSFLNAANPLSRETGFQSRKQAVAEAARRREMWERAVDTKYMGLMEMIRPPWRFKGEVGD